MILSFWERYRILLFVFVVASRYVIIVCLLVSTTRIRYETIRQHIARTDIQRRVARHALERRQGRQSGQVPTRRQRERLS
jgi:hypothetical protein